MHDIIIVDDEVLVRLGIKSYIESSGLNVRIAGTFSNGRDALEYCKSNPPKIVFTDITMPIMDGIQLIEELRKLNAQIRIIVLSCHDDYKFIKGSFKLGAVDYLLKHELEEDGLVELVESLLRDVELADKESFHDTRDERNKSKATLLEELKRRDPDVMLDGAFEEKLKSNHPHMGTREIVVLKIKIDREYDDKMVVVKKNQNDSSIHDSLAELFEQSGIGELFEDGDFGFVGCLSYQRERSEKTIQEKQLTLTNAIQNTFKKYFNCSASIGISSRYSSLAYFNTAYNEAEHNLLFSFYIGTECVIERAGAFDTSYAQDNTKLQRLNELIMDRSYLLMDTAGLASEVAAYLHHLVKLQVCPENFKNEASCIVQMINVFMLDHWGMRIEQLDHSIGTILLGRFAEVDYAGMIIRFMEQLILGMGVKASELARSSTLANRILRYIDNHYSEDLTLQSVSEIFHMNRNYFCQYFKKETGRNFIEYVTEVRIENAKIIMKANNIPTSKVAAQVGFPNENYFIKVFKKITGERIKDFKKS